MSDETEKLRIEVKRLQEKHEAYYKLVSDLLAALSIRVEAKLTEFISRYASQQYGFRDAAKQVKQVRDDLRGIMQSVRNSSLHKERV